MTFREYNTALGWSIFGIIWAIAILGITLNSIDIKKFKVFSMICYLGMGWCIIFTAKLLPKLLGIPGLLLLVSGGVAYIRWCYFVWIGKKEKVYAFYISFIYITRKYIAVFLYIIVCGIKCCNFM